MTPSTKALASTPPMGWNSWNMFGQDIADSKAELTQHVEPYEAILLKISL